MNVKLYRVAIGLLALLVVLSIKLIPAAQPRYATIAAASLNEKSVEVFLYSSNATLFAIVNYDYTNAKQIITYLYPLSEQLEEADLHLGKQSSIAQYNDTYQAHLRNSCYYRVPLTYRKYELGLNYRVSYAFYSEDNPQPLGYLIAWFADDLDEGSAQKVCRLMGSLASNLE